MLPAQNEVHQLLGDEDIPLGCREKLKERCSLQGTRGPADKQQETVMEAALQHPCRQHAPYTVRDAISWTAEALFLVAGREQREDGSSLQGTGCLQMSSRDTRQKFSDLLLQLLLWLLAGSLLSCRARVPHLTGLQAEGVRGFMRKAQVV